MHKCKIIWTVIANRPTSVSHELSQQALKVDGDDGWVRGTIGCDKFVCVLQHNPNWRLDSTALCIFFHIEICVCACFTLEHSNAGHIFIGIQSIALIGDEGDEGEGDRRIKTRAYRQFVTETPIKNESTSVVHS